MGMKKLILVVVILTGCATASKLNELEIGMTKADVIKKLGKPESASTIGENSYLTYRLQRSTLDETTDVYLVKLKDNKVVSYGRDIEVRPGENRLILDHNITNK